MLKIQNITNEPIQTHLIKFFETEITLKLYFYDLVQAWFIDVDYKGKSVKGIKLSLGVLHTRSANYPFDFIVVGGGGLDPFLANDFAGGRYKLFLIEPDEMIKIRGIPVEI